MREYTEKLLVLEPINPALHLMGIMTSGLTASNGRFCLVNEALKNYEIKQIERFRMNVTHSGFIEKSRKGFIALLVKRRTSEAIPSASRASWEPHNTHYHVAMFCVLPVSKALARLL
jgi:hypothetical protein